RSREESLGREQRLRLANTHYAMFPAFVAAQDLNFHPQKINGHSHLGLGQTRHTHRVLFRRDNHFQVPPDTTFYETNELYFGIIVMIDVALGEIDMRTELFQCTFEAFRCGNGANRADESVTQTLQPPFFTGETILKIRGLVGAFDDLGCGIVAANTFQKGIVWFAGIFRDKDIAGPSQISRRLTQGASRKEEFITKRGLPIHKDNVQPMFEMEILQAVVE